jgi:hypothetical protein
MSANAHQSPLAVAVGPAADDAPAAHAAHAADVDVAQTAAAASVAATATPTAEPDPITPAPDVVLPHPAAVPVPASAARASPRLASAGYVLLLLSTVLAVAIPHFHLRAGLIEASVMVVAIVGLLAGMTLVTGAFVVHLLRRH